MAIEQLDPKAVMAHRQDKAFDAIRRERDHQDNKWGTVQEHPHTVAEWMLIMRKELQEAEQAWMKGGDEDAMREMLQVVAVGVAAMEQHGIHERDWSSIAIGHALGQPE